MLRGQHARKAAAKRSYPTSEVRNSRRKCQAVMAQERPRGATPPQRSGGTESSYPASEIMGGDKRSYPMSEVRRCDERSYLASEFRGCVRRTSPASEVKVGQPEVLPRV